jgi:hypothetical protein
VFNGSRFRAEIVPRISDFALSINAVATKRVPSAVGPRASVNGAAHPPAVE